MKRLIPTYIAASNMLFQQKKRGQPKRNATVDPIPFGSIFAWEGYCGFLLRAS